MKTPPDYVASQSLRGEGELLRKHSLTRWMSRDLLQAATDFCKHLGLIAIYAECSTDQRTRYLFWQPPPGAYFEIRSGRTEAQFRQFDQANFTKGWPLLSLHINEGGVYSAVWISPEHHETGVAVLARYGITPAERKTAG